MEGLELRTCFDDHYIYRIVDLKQLCNSFGILPRCSHNGSMDNMKFYFGDDKRRKDRFAEGITRIFEIKKDVKRRRQVFGKRMACPWVVWNS